MLPSSWVCIALFLWIVATITTTTIAMPSPPAAAAVRKVAIIGGGAAGLAASRVFSREGIEDVTVLEANSQTTGGVWKHMCVRTRRESERDTSGMGRGEAERSPHISLCPSRETSVVTVRLA